MSKLTKGLSFLSLIVFCLVTTLFVLSKNGRLRKRVTKRLYSLSGMWRHYRFIWDEGYVDVRPLEYPHDFPVQNFYDPTGVFADREVDVPSCETLCDHTAGPNGKYKGLILRGKCGANKYVHIIDNHIPVAYFERSHWSAPCILRFHTSRIPNAGQGVWTKVDLPPGVIFGPFVGEVLSPDMAEERLKSGKTVTSAGYTWSITGDPTQLTYDAFNKSKGNWMRQVNSAMFWQEQNLHPVMVRSGLFDWPMVYYVTMKHIRAQTELLVWYGYEAGVNFGAIYDPSQPRTFHAPDRNWRHVLNPKLRPGWTPP